MNIFGISALSAVLLMTPAAHGFSAPDNRAKFRETYQAYEAAIADGERSDARKHAKLAYELGKTIFGVQNKNTAALALNYGRLLGGDEAERVLLEALKLHEDLYGNDAFELLDPLMDIAAAHTGYGRLGKARRYYSRALNIATKHKGKNNRVVGIINMEIGQVALSEAQSKEAIRYLKHAEKIFETLEGEDAEIRLAQTRFWIGKYRLSDNSEEAAIRSLLSSLETFARVAPDSPMTLTNHAFLVEAYERQGKQELATKHCRAIGAAKPLDPDQDYKPVFKKHPNYPPKAGEGFVILAMTVDENGFVHDPYLVEHEGSERLVRAALDVVTSYRYAPRFENGKPVATKDVKHRFTFSYAD
ncbi:energy transducer TonB [Kordiimonas aestuarii]|uniref:energy transducer TonB n=1 Tax=Kordiimonas aestuarii TaxID=1005925 RepID=UPI0021D37EA1|nr:energy transducer TonB [Kordiimonas aestuarii]